MSQVTDGVSKTPKYCRDALDNDDDNDDNDDIDEIRKTDGSRSLSEMEA